MYTSFLVNTHLPFLLYSVKPQRCAASDRVHDPGNNERLKMGGKPLRNATAGDQHPGFHVPFHRVPREIGAGDETNCPVGHGNFGMDASSTNGSAFSRQA